MFVQLVTKKNSWKIIKFSSLVCIELAVNLVMCVRKIMLAAISLVEEAQNNPDHITTAINTAYINHTRLNRGNIIRCSVLRQIHSFCQ
uniref:Uncharacterized protein n=1 Tax=Timema bartmani TaxID=61472 RepID=A0A7R9FC15_9NEOP|nr:unnamed protein product [Timema bartmani]